MTAKKQKYMSFTRRALSLISEPDFIRVEHNIREPNIFRIVGRTHYERWHSAYWGWLLDPNGSHLLSDYVLRRFLLLLLDDRCLRAKNGANDFLIKILSTIQFEEIEVAPNEYVSVETSVAGVGRFDIFVTARYTDNTGNTGRLNLLFELKIDSHPTRTQSTKYADWLLGNHPQDINILVYLTPSLQADSFSTVGDERWYCLDYQLVNDKLLVPLLRHPYLNEKVRPFIVQYIKNLSNRHKGVKMAITEDEKQLALALYEKYGDVFDSIYDALVAAGAIQSSTSDIDLNKGRETGRLAVRLDGKVFSDDTVRLLFGRVLKYLVQEDYVLRLPLPWGKGSQRYILTNQEPPVHPNGRPFFYPVTIDGYSIESHYDRNRAMKVLADLCSKMEVDFEVIDV